MNVDVRAYDPMPLFVHIADERDAASIRRVGLTLPKAHLRDAESERHKYGIFGLPLTPNFMVSHQWLRVLKLKGHRTAVGVYFSLKDDEPVWVGRYNEPKRLVTAAEAAATLRELETLGFETTIPRSISPKEITSVRSLPQALGWRNFPGAHEKGIYCCCKFCQKGKIKGRRVWEPYEREVSGL
jgi:hypothetical protein